MMDFVSDLEQLIEMLNFNYAVALLMEYAAFFQLRVERPNLERPYRIPFGTMGCLIFFAPSIFGTIFVLTIAGKATYIMFLSTIAIGIVIVSLWQKGDHPSRIGFDLPESDLETYAFTNAERPEIVSD